METENTPLHNVEIKVYKIKILSMNEMTDLIILLKHEVRGLHKFLFNFIFCFTYVDELVD